MEYALLVALIAVVCIGAVTFLGGGTSDTIEDAGNGIGGGEGGGCPAGSHRGTNAMVNGPGAYADGYEGDDRCWDDVTGYGTGPYAP